MHRTHRHRNPAAYALRAAGALLAVQPAAGAGRAPRTWTSPAPTCSASSRRSPSGTGFDREALSQRRSATRVPAEIDPRGHRAARRAHAGLVGIPPALPDRGAHPARACSCGANSNRRSRTHRARHAACPPNTCSPSPASRPSTAASWAATACSMRCRRSPSTIRRAATSSAGAGAVPAARPRGAARSARAASAPTPARWARRSSCRRASALRGRRRRRRPPRPVDRLAGRVRQRRQLLHRARLAPRRARARRCAGTTTAAGRPGARRASRCSDTVGGAARTRLPLRHAARADCAGDAGAGAARADR